MSGAGFHNWFNTILGSAGFAAIIIALLTRRKTNSEATLNNAGAWEKFVDSQEKALDAVRKEAEAARKDADESRKEIDRLRTVGHSDRTRILVLERQRNEALFWQAQVTSREGIVSALLAERGITVPPMPNPPIVRDAHTRAEDREDGDV